MIGILKGGAIGLGLGLLLSVGAYFNGRDAGKAAVQTVLNKQRAVWAAAFDKQSADTAAKEAVLAAQLKERDDAWKARLAVAESAVDGLSARLRRATSRSSCPVPGNSPVAGTPTDGAVSGGIEEIERDADAAWRACAADSAALIEVVARYNLLEKANGK